MIDESATYDNDHGDPTGALVVTDTHDVSRLVAMLQSGNGELGDAGDHTLRHVHRHNGGRAALQLLATQGGPGPLLEVDTEAVSR